MVGCGAVQSSGCQAHLTASASTSSSPSATAWHTICKQTPWASCTQVQLVRWQAMPQLALAAAALQRRVALCEHGCSPGASAQPHLAHAAHDGSHTAGVRAAAERQQEAARSRPAIWKAGFLKATEKQARDSSPVTHPVSYAANHLAKRGNPCSPPHVVTQPAFKHFSAYTPSLLIVLSKHQAPCSLPQVIPQPAAMLSSPNDL